MQKLVSALENTFVTQGLWVFAFQMAFQAIREGKIVTTIDDGKKCGKKDTCL